MSGMLMVASVIAHTFGVLSGWRNRHGEPHISCLSNGEIDVVLRERR